MRWLLVLTLSLFVCAAPSWACSVNASYKIPTNFELVQKANVIVLARVKDVPADVDVAMSGDKPFVTLEPVRFLKGSVSVEQLRLMGWRPPKNWDGVTTTTTLAQAHFSSGLGACIRQFYAPGDLVVAMFDRNLEMKAATGRELNQIGDPWARSAESVDSGEDVWVHAVERYVAMQAPSPTALNDRIEATIAELGQIGTAEAEAIAADLEYHLTRKDPENVWANFSTPMSTTAGVIGQKGVALYCIAGTQPGLLVTGKPPTKVRVVVDGVAHEAQPAVPSAAEKLLIDSPADRIAGSRLSEEKSLFRFAASDTAIAALRRVTGTVAIESDGRTIISGRPLDALLRWARQCEKLEKIPAPTE